MSNIQHRSTRSAPQICDISGHPKFATMNWEDFNRKLNAYMRKRGLLDEPFLRGIAARKNKAEDDNMEPEPVPVKKKSSKKKKRSK